jgi:hypothetical protein
MALSLESLCRRGRGRAASAPPFDCEDGTRLRVSDYDLNAKYGVDDPDPGASYYLQEDPLDPRHAAPKRGIQAEFTTLLSNFIVDECVDHLFKAVAAIQRGLTEISPRLRIVIKGGLSMYIGLMALAAASGDEGVVADARRLAKEGVFSPGDLDTQIVWIGQDVYPPGAPPGAPQPVVTSDILKEVDGVVLKALRALNTKLRDDKLLETFIAELARKRGVTREQHSTDLKIEKETLAAGLVKVTPVGKVDSPFFVSINDSIDRFKLWRNKLMVGYSEEPDCSIKLELLDVTMGKNSDAESKAIVRGVFGASAETDLVARELIAELEETNNGPRNPQSIEYKNLIEAINVCNELQQGIRTDYSVAETEISAKLPPTPNKRQTSITEVLESISKVPGDDEVKRYQSKRRHFDLRLTPDGDNAAAAVRVAVCDLEYNAIDTLKVILETLLLGGGDDDMKLVKRMKRFVFLALVSFDTLGGGFEAKRYLLFFIKDAKIMQELGLGGLIEPTGEEVLQKLMEKDPAGVTKADIRADNVVDRLRNKISLLKNPAELVRTTIEEFKTIWGKLDAKKDVIQRAFEDVGDTIGTLSRPEFEMKCIPGQGPGQGMNIRRYPPVISGGGGVSVNSSGGDRTSRSSGGAAVSDGYGLWAAALMSVVAAVGAGAGAAACAVTASPGAR